MWDLLHQPAVQAALALAVLFVVVSVGFQVLKSLRPATSKADTNEGDLSTNFDEMLSEGVIDEAELRRIRAVLGKSQDSPGS